MYFSKTTEYALRVMSHMATDEKKLYSTQGIHRALGIPLRYLRKQMQLLSRRGLVGSIQGKYGGYRIARDLDKISLLDIVLSVGDTRFDDACFFGYTDCVFNNKCFMHDKWIAIKDNIYDLLASTTLSEIKNHRIQTIS